MKMYLAIQRIVKVPKFYLTCKLKPLKGLRICTSSLTIAWVPWTSRNTTK